MQSMMLCDLQRYELIVGGDVDVDHDVASLAATIERMPPDTDVVVDLRRARDLSRDTAAAIRTVLERAAARGLSFSVVVERMSLTAVQASVWLTDVAAIEHVRASTR